jgi:hypothetical protein
MYLSICFLFTYNVGMSHCFLFFFPWMFGSTIFQFILWHLGYFSLPIN